MIYLALAGKEDGATDRVLWLAWLETVRVALN